jgi:hypothetical protein
MKDIVIYLTEAYGFKMCCFYIYMTLPCTVLLGKFLPHKRKLRGGFRKGGRKGEKQQVVCMCEYAHMHVWCKFLTWNLDHKMNGPYSAIFL